VSHISTFECVYTWFKYIGIQHHNKVLLSVHAHSRHKVCVDMRYVHISYVHMTYMLIKHIYVYAERSQDGMPRRNVAICDMCTHVTCIYHKYTYIIYVCIYNIYKHNVYTYTHIGAQTVCHDTTRVYMMYVYM